MQRLRRLVVGRMIIPFMWTMVVAVAVLVDGAWQEPDIEIDRSSRDATFYETCTLRSVENICARNITMAREDGSIVRAPGVTIWIQAHCGHLNEAENEQKRSECVLSYVADDFGDDQATEFFSCVCDECPRACTRKGNLRNRQNIIAKDSQ